VKLQFLLQNLQQACWYSPPHPNVVPIDSTDRSNGAKPFAGNDSGAKEPFFSNRPAVNGDGIHGAERWVALCAQAAVEKDPKKLLELVSEINRLLDARRKRLSSPEDGVSKSAR
jgi:hypothetical protein